MATTEPTPDFDTAAEHAPGNETLAKSYRLVAELFVNPELIDRERLLSEARGEILPALAEDVGEETAARLRTFLDEYESLSTETYVETHELSPACPLYLGHYGFEEPETCRDVADADRNQYMVELNAIYEHYGFEIGEELPDFLPAMVEFCYLTLPERGDGLRAEFQRKLLALLPAMHDRFEAYETPYRHLLDVVERLITYDLAGDPTAAVDVPDVDDIEGLSVPEDAVAATGGGR